MIPIEGQQFISRYAGMRTIIHANHWCNMISDKLEELQFKYPKWQDKTEKNDTFEESGGGFAASDKKNDEEPKTEDTESKSKVSIRKSPKEFAKLYPDGFTKAGEDGKLWVVKKYPYGMTDGFAQSKIINNINMIKIDLNLFFII